MKIVIPGTPIAKARHRSFLFGKHIKTYDPQAKEKERCKLLLINAIRDAYDDPDRNQAVKASNLAYADVLSIELTFHMPYPISKSKRETNTFLWGLQCMDTKPDLDNLEKHVLDFCNGILYQDDKQIVELKSKKLYSLNPRTEINIMAKKKLELHETAEAILQTINPKDFKDLMEITYALCCFTSSFDKNGNLKDECIDSEAHRQQLTEAAVYVSILAEKYASYLTKIKKDFPRFCEVYENSELNKNALRGQLRDGKILC